jgi:hypothetical protein
MLVCTSWKSRPLTAAQANRMMEVWAKVEASQAENPAVERVCFYIYSDATGGFTVNKANDVDAAIAWELEVSLALGEFLELESNLVLDLDAAMPAIEKGIERINA